MCYNWRANMPNVECIRWQLWQTCDLWLSSMLGCVNYLSLLYLVHLSIWILLRPPNPTDIWQWSVWPYRGLISFRHHFGITNGRNIDLLWGIQTVKANGMVRILTDKSACHQHILGQAVEGVHYSHWQVHNCKLIRLIHMVKPNCTKHLWYMLHG